MKIVVPKYEPESQGVLSPGTGVCECRTQWSEDALTPSVYEASFQ